MKPIFFVILAGLLLLFLYKCMTPEDSRNLISRLTQLLPVFEGEDANIKKFAACLALMIFVLGIVKLVFRSGKD